MTQLRSVPPWHTARVLGIICFLLGAVFSCIGLIGVMIWSTESPIVTLTALIASPVLAGVLGFGATAAGCSIYNQLAAWMGGIDVELVGDVAASQPLAGEDGSLNPDEAIEAGRAPKARSQVRSISISHVKPNPAGKLRSKDSLPSAEEICGEWVDIRNHGMNTVTPKGVCLYHLAYLASGGAPEGRLVVSLPDRWLKPGETLRVHSGQRRDLASLPAEDRSGADWHAFVGEGAFNYNHREGDTLILYEVATEATIDSASYDGNPPEDLVLVRQGFKLMPPQAAVSRA